MLRMPGIIYALTLVTACTSYGVIENNPSSSQESSAYSMRAWDKGESSSDIGLLLAFSGGGTRAAALSYGVLEELRDTSVIIDGRSRRLLDEVDRISSVSGGSFTAAYYGLHGDGIFEDFEEVFLKRNVQGDLLRGLFNPLQWFSFTGRTEMAVRYYEKNVFGGATYADMLRDNHPLILINASDLGYGVRFSFIQEYFNMLCSDLNSFPVARAVAASSAVPVLFNPVVVENFDNCDTTKPAWLVEAEARAVNDPQMSMLTHGLASYLDKDKRKYAHFVDGGITDNLGLRAIYDIIELSGGVKTFMSKLKRQPPRYIVVISVNASTDPEPTMDLSNKQPSLKESINAMSDVQLHRYNAATLELMKESLAAWAAQLSTPERPVKSYFIQLDFEQLQEPDTRLIFNRMPTSFSLSDEQVDTAIKAGRLLLRENLNFLNLLSESGN